MRLRPTWIVVAFVAAIIAACSGKPLQSPASGPGTAFRTPTGPTTFDGDEGSPNPPPESPMPPDPSNPMPGDPNMPAPPPGNTPAPTSPYTWTPEGMRLDNLAAGFDGVIADVSTIQLNDGRWRMYVYAGGQYRSAISPDGLTFAMEAGTRLAAGLGHTRAVRLIDGRIRAFSQVGDGIASSVSSDDGQTFAREAGLRVAAAAVGFTPSGVSNIVRTLDGLWRLYFSSLPRPGEGPLPHKVMSATSMDLFTWTLDPGVRLGPGATLTESAEHPGAIVNPDGSVSLFYFRNTTFKLMMSTAADGLTFASEYDSGISQANDPDVIPLSDGTVRMYYNWGDNARGAIYSALYAGAPFAATDPAPPPVPMPMLLRRPAAAAPFWRRFGFTPAF